MEIRQLSPADARAYQSLRLLALQESPTAFSASHGDEAGRSIEEVSARLVPAKDGSICMFGVFDQAELAGFLAVVHPQREKLRHCIELAGMYVAPPYRRRGFGGALLKAAIDHCQSVNGVRQIKLGVNATNVAAKALYESVGFESYGVEPDAMHVDGIFYGEEHYILRICSVA
ncbi:GNAT family N-acetyltransferase [Dyella dinghuensis]|uniref:GNAT family N-acetyltransferase n=1 Tax=Dyella dinghuensis TaxID=1920169 RepID=A0A3S0WN83_9GAMM|nr:GNAT family N-acetyltransferase [Dyella dinghuensis]RUL63108.1 GNAT family N-acetyltransferase [Dyella dinghuensis]